MQNALRKFGGAALLGLCLANPALPQAPAKADEKPKAAADTHTLDGIIGIEDANTRITALLQFLKTNTTGEKALTAREALVASYAQLGENQINDNNIEKAVDAFQRAIRALPKQVSDRFFDETVSRIPMVISARGYRAESVSLGKLIETRFANEPTRLASLGEFYLTIEASGEAIKTLEQAAKLAPEDPRLHRALGSAYRMGLRIDEAIASYQLAVRYAPQDRRAFYDLANLYRSQGAYDDAIKLYRRQLEIDPKHSPSLKGLALSLTALGKDDQAAAELNKARDLRGSIEEITQDLLLQTQLTFYYLSQNKFRQARQASDAALAIEPRFSWARIAAAEVELAEGKYFEAERHLLAAQKLANFPTLAFTLGKVYLVVEDFDGAAEQFAKAFRYSAKDKFTTRLGGIRDVQSDDLRELLAPEHQAAIFLAEAPTSDELFRIAESLVRVNSKISEAEDGKAKTQAESEKILDLSARAFVQAEGSRRSFRALFMANKLAQAGRALPLAIRLAEQALELAEIATETEGSMRDYPNYDREGRLHVFRGRAHDARGWAMFKAGRTKDAIVALSQAVNEFGNLPEAKRALWHLATAHEAAGAHPLALEMYLAAYEPPASKGNIDIQRTVIETIYRKVNGSLTGIDSALGKSLKQRTSEDIAATARTAPALPIEIAANASNPTATEPTVSAATSESKPAQSPTELIITRPTVTRENNALAANSKTAGSVTTPPSATTNPPAASESTRVGLFNIPVNNRGARGNAPLNNRAAKPEAPPATAAPVVTAQKTEPAPVKELAKTVELPPAALPPAIVAKNEPPANEAGKETSIKTEEPKTETLVEPAVKVAESKTNEAATTITITNEHLIAPITNPLSANTTSKSPEQLIAETKPEETKPEEPKAEPVKALPTPVQLPELPAQSLQAISLLATSHVLAETMPSLDWLKETEAPEPPASFAPKPAISATAATQASTEPAITVRYENLPGLPATPTGESGHVISPPTTTTTTTTRPRRVPNVDPSTTKAPEKDTPTESIPFSGTTRQRRVPTSPTKP